MFGFPFGPKNVSAAEAYERLGTSGHVLLDVRTREEVRAESIPGALHISLDRLETEAEHLKKYTSVHVICRSGGRSSTAANLLRGLGITHVASVEGGLLAWQKAGFPVSR
ncbi:MAG: rhodanese-like domain-containing protein [Patescibacteria group bacterium]|nr:rhodanese-like domain-containing protein [Patescibacteria group bacterium]